MEQAMAFLVFNGRNRAREYVEAMGHEHGRYGMVYWPPSVWGTNHSGWGKGQKMPKPATEPERVYREAYIAGRKEWHDRYGYWPEGCDSEDVG